MTARRDPRTHSPSGALGAALVTSSEPAVPVPPWHREVAASVNGAMESAETEAAQSDLSDAPVSESSETCYVFESLATEVSDDKVQLATEVHSQLQASKKDATTPPAVPDDLKRLLFLKRGGAMHGMPL